MLTQRISSQPWRILSWSSTFVMNNHDTCVPWSSIGSLLKIPIYCRYQYIAMKITDVWFQDIAIPITISNVTILESSFDDVDKKWHRSPLIYQRFPNQLTKNWYAVCNPSMYVLVDVNILLVKIEKYLETRLQLPGR